MRFDLTKPCDGCPFRSDVEPYISPARVVEFDRALERKTFACHKTTVYNDETDDMESTPASQHCAGALILLEKMNRRGDMQQIAQRLGLYDPSKLKMDSPVYENFRDMLRAHRKATR